jgi:signal transduction histidine kinase
VHPFCHGRWLLVHIGVSDDHRLWAVRYSTDLERDPSGWLLARALPYARHVSRNAGGTVAIHDAPLTIGEVRGRLTAGAAQRITMVAVVPLVASAVWLAATSEHVERPTATALYRGYLVAAPLLVGLYWWLRRPASRFGPLLVCFGGTAWVYSLQSSDVPLLFDLGVVAEAPALWLTFYLFLAFPTGRLEGRAVRALMAALAIILAGFFVPWTLLSPVIAGGGPLSVCAPACPENVLQIGSDPRLVEWAGKAETYGALAVTVGVLVVYALRVRGATHPQRRALIAVAATSLLFLPVFFAFHFARLVLEVSPSAVESMGWLLVGARILLPLGFLAALWQAEFFAAASLRRLLERLATRPTVEAWRDEVASTLDDPPLQIGYHDPTSGGFREPGGAELLPPPADSGRTWVPADRNGPPVAAMVVDEALTEDPELIRAAAAATLLAVENGHLEGELRASRARTVEAGNTERRRLERDLHDSTQQRLLALRINLGLAGEQLERPEDRARIEQLGADLEDAIDDLRNVARGIYPQLLSRYGVAEALASVTANGSIAVDIRDTGLARHPEGVELTVYFCCLEALQNAAKHAGREASAVVRLGQDRDGVHFSVEDDGVGFDPASIEHTGGLANLADRAAAVGGTLRIESAVGCGTRVEGSIPL